MQVAVEEDEKDAGMKEIFAAAFVSEDVAAAAIIALEVELFPGYGAFRNLVLS